MKHFIITGASRGIGYSLAVSLAAPGITLHITARGDLGGLLDIVSKRGASAHAYQFDLSRTDGITVLTDEIFGNISMPEATYIGLVNNAGMLHPIGPMGKHDTEHYRQNLEVNFVAPALLMHEFVKRTAGFSGELRVLNVSSGASQNAYHGWSHYCSTKAGLDMLTDCLHLEHRDRIKTYGFNPGRTDTQMQDEIREQSPEDFQYVQSFIEAKSQGKLNSPDTVAGMMKIVLTEDRFEPGKMVSVRDF
ncbi:benzil reductase ((S)-benzoin forming) [Cyclonatronum proteinivorum]|uniref:Benzil reductase ((S)-benzoin forming) n=1 Tax=Cyclonatronum proteinivorum TaxID=1457365 RepID=A0A345UJK6_9BACT|nr:SDR family NAD(P)-dependent oxidoreductase [Cyclonatronum proteinivorum]AXJ00658.1 benzil reductase ((S)-benzoin forming) [Cyclonatronum proteinivorum]